MKIAIMGSKEFADRVKGIIRQEYRDAELKTVYYQRYIEIIDFLQTEQKQYDGILFPGHVSYMYAEGLVKKETLWEYIPINAGSFYRALLELYVQGHDIYNLSIDTYKQGFVQEAYDEIGIDNSSTRLYFENEMYEDENYYYYLLEFHRKNFFSGKAGSCITGVSEVWQKLLEDKIPCVRTKPTSHVILDIYNKLYIKHLEGMREKETLAIIAIHIDFPRYHSLSGTNEYDQLVSKFEMAKQIMGLASRVNGASIETTNRDYIIVTDRKTLEAETGNLETLYLSTLFTSCQNHNISMGIGFGCNTEEAMRRAYMGMSRSMKLHDSVAYVFYDDTHQKGPVKILMNPCAERSGSIETRLKEAGLGAVSARKIAQVLYRSEKNEFTSKELAGLCGMTKRNMDRIVQKLEETNCCRIIGEQNSNAAGRPARVIAFDLFGKTK